MSKPNLGHQPLHPMLRMKLAELTFPGSDCEPVVHHYTDSRDRLQLEVERRIEDPNALGGTRCEFERLVL